MFSNCLPQLQLGLQSNTTSFKHSFEQFGFDLESPGGAIVPPTLSPSIEETQDPTGYIIPPVIDTTVGNPGAFTDVIDDLPQPNIAQTTLLNLLPTGSLI
jgi:hypothetical protein